MTTVRKPEHRPQFKISPKSLLTRLPFYTVDGTARFVGSDTIVTMAPEDLVDPPEYDILSQAVNANGQPYQIVELPITEKLIGGYNGVYINYYVGNDVVIVPIFDDANDQEALNILADLYPGRTVTGINMEELYLDGGAAHCVTQQQPVAVRRR